MKHALRPLPAIPRVSVFTTVYNHERWVADAVESVLAQDWPSEYLEYVVLDDGSTDGSWDIIRSYADRTPWMRAIRQDNQGVRAAVNRVMEMMSGDLITSVAGDDMMPPDKIRVQAEYMLAHQDIGLLYSDMEVIDVDGRTVHPSFIRMFNIVPHEGSPVGELLAANFVSGGSVMLRGDAKQVFHPVPEDGGWEDYWWAWTVSRAGRIAYLDRPTYRYRRHEQNLALGAEGERLHRAHKVELPWRRRMLREVAPDEATATHLVRAAGALLSIVAQMTSVADCQAEAVAPVTRDQARTGDQLAAAAHAAWADGDLDGAAFACATSLGADPHRPDMHALLRHLAQALQHRAKRAERIVPDVGAVRRVLVYADVEELLEEPELLVTYRGAVGGGDNATLLIHAPGWTAADVDSRLVPLLHALGLDRDDGPDIAVHLGPSGERPLLLEHADAVLTAGALRGTTLPQADRVDSSALQALLTQAAAA